MKATKDRHYQLDDQQVVVVSVTDAFVIYQPGDGVTPEMVMGRGRFEQVAEAIRWWEHPFMCGSRIDVGAMVPEVRLRSAPHPDHGFGDPDAWCIDLSLVPDSAYVYGANGPNCKLR